MPDPSPAPADCDDDALADKLADAWIEQAANNPALRRAALRAVGLLKEPADMTVQELAEVHCANRHQLNRIAARALEKLRLSPEIRTLL
jgi:hypothetical protein